MSDSEHNNSDEAIRDWTAERVETIKSPYYPLSENGPLCPLLDDKNLLYQFYVTSGRRKEVKRFCKTHRWEGRPQYPYTMTEEALKDLLRSMCNSPSARLTLRKSDQCILLHNIIWGWLSYVNKPMFATAKACGHEDAKGNVFMTPTELRTFLDTPDGENPVSARRQKTYVAIAFAMLEPESRHAIVAELVNHIPDVAVGLGLIPQPSKEEDSPKLLPSHPIEIPTITTVESEPPSNQETAVAFRDPPAPFNCWVVHIGKLVAKTEELRKTTDQFAKISADLSTIETVSAFAESGTVHNELSTLGHSRQQIIVQSNEILGTLTSPCSNTSEKCELQRFREQVQAKPPKTITELTITARTMHEKAIDLTTRAQSARKEIRTLITEAANLSKLLQSPDTSPQIPSDSVFPCKTLTALSNEKRIVSELRQKVDAETLRRKDLLIAAAERIRKQYDLGTGSSFKDCFAAYNELQSRIEVADDIEDVQECENLLEDLQIKCRAAEQFDHRKLAGRLQKEPEAFSVFLDLCHTLVDQGSPEVAYLLLHVRQRVHQFEEIAEQPDRSLALLLETACVSAENQLPLDTVWESLCSQPWLLSIEHGDIQSPDLLERIVLTLIGAALSGHEEVASKMLARLGARELSRQRFSGQLDEILQSVLARQSIRLATPEQLARNLEQEESLRESLSYEGGKYRHLQCGKAHHFARFETVHVFPALAALWQAVSSDLRARRFDAAQARVAELDAAEWYDDLVRNSDKVIDEHPHFSVKIKTFIQSFVERLQAYVAYNKAVWQDDALVIVGTSFVEALEQWAGSQKARVVVAELVSRTLQAEIATLRRPTDFWHSISLCSSVLLRCPHFVTWLRAQTEPAPDIQLEQILFADLAVDRPIAETIQVLESDSAWEHLSALPTSDQHTSDPQWKVKSQQDLLQLSSFRQEVQAIKDPRFLAMFDACVEGGRYQAARQLLQQCGQRKAEERAEQKQQVTSFADENLKHLDDVKELAFAANMSPQWTENVCALATKVELQLRRFKRADGQQETSDETQSRLAKAVNVLRYLIEQRSSVLDEVECLLSADLPKNTSTSLTTSDKDSARSKCPELNEAWKVLARSEDNDDNSVRRFWASFTRDFLKTCNLYHDERDDQHRFTTVPSIKYPFSVFQTAFYKPQSEFLKRPLRLYLYHQQYVDIQALQRLEAELSGENAAAWLHIVFVPHGYDRIQRYFKYDIGYKDFLLVDETFLFRVMLSEKHDVPVRRALHASVADLVCSSPFVAQTYCHQSNNIYVGRKEVLQKLLNTPQAMIWGGRRIGKTSVLHVLETALRNRNYRVAYVYVDIPHSEDPDLAIAKKLCSTLDLPPAESLSEFEQHVTKLRSSGTRIAFLIDEVDEYIKKSRLAHGDAFPLATTLRQLVMDDSAKDTRLVYSGYQQLYYEAKLNKEKRRVGHPFINTGQDVPIGNLLIDDVRDLVSTGFEDMLDMTVDPDVPTLIFRRASGHPAFVQQFCRCLLERLSKRRSRDTHDTITTEDVEAVYSASATTEGGEQPFIFYVNETLGYNLSHLGRATMIAICDLVGNTRRNDNSSFSIQEARSELDVWCEVAHISPPDPTHFTQTIDLLVMTNMLTPDSSDHDHFRVTYPTYIDILQRLNKLGRAEIVQSLDKYDAEERKSGVLL